MDEKVLIVDITAQKLLALVIDQATGEEHSFETPFVDSLPGALDDALGALFADMETGGMDRDFSHVMLALSPTHASLRTLKLPFTESAKIEEVLPFELADSLVEDVEDLVIGSLPLLEGSTLAVSVEKKVVQGVIDSFESLNLSVNFIGFSLPYKGSVLTDLHGHEGTAALVDSSSIVVLKDSVPALYTYISDMNDLKFALASLSVEGVEVESFYSSPVARKWLDDLALESSSSEPYNDDNIGTRSLEFLYRDGYNKDPMNFRKGRFEDKRVLASTRKSLKLATALVVCLAIFWSAGIYSRFSAANKGLAGIEDRLGSTYSELFTGESVVDPLYQFEIKIKELGEERAFVGGGIDVLGTLKGLGEGAGEGAGGAVNKEAGLKLFEINMRQERVLARGEAGNFEEADRFKERLSKVAAFNDISLTDVKKKSAGKVSFSIALSLEEK